MKQNKQIIAWLKYYLPFAKKIIKNISYKSKLKSLEKINIESNFSIENDKLLFHKFLSFNEYIDYTVANEIIIKKRKNIEYELAISQKDFYFLAFNPIINKNVPYVVSINNSQSKFSEKDVYKIPDYRESVTCELTKTNSRLRALYSLLLNLNELNLISIDECYIAEQVTPFYKVLKSIIPNIVGSEFLGEDIKSGYIANSIIINSTVYKNILHQDLTKTSFLDQSFNTIITCEVLEHNPNYKSALHEIYRTLKKDGDLIISVPFDLNKYDNTVRAVLNTNGEIEHILEPEYHGDPVEIEGGCLCFQTFGWELLDQLKAVGFKETMIYSTWSIKNGILGDICFIRAKK